MKKQSIGLVGLGVMGQNLALNIERNGFSVAGFDLDKSKLKLYEKIISEKNIFLYSSISELIQNLSSPKTILLMVPAGDPVDLLIKEITPFLSRGDILIDGGNSYFKDTEKRYKDLKDKGILFIGTGISGGEEGALWGPSIMPGGNPEAWLFINELFQAISAKVDGKIPCCNWIGNGGAGHFVKMVHNGIEYADMQMICEAYFLMEKILGLTTDEMYNVFTEWNKGELNSYLIEITADILKKNDEETGKPMIHVILDTAGQKGTGKSTSQSALDFGVPAQTIAEAVFARFLSAVKDERIQASKVLGGIDYTFDGNKQDFIKLIKDALYASKICSYAQGFQLMRAASKEYGWDLNYGNIALIWRGGCIIRAQFLEKIKDAYNKNPELANLLLDDYFKDSIKRCEKGWRKVVSNAVELGIPVPALSSALSYFDAYRCERLPANLLQAQRDYFGAHSYERIDKPRGEFFHTEWLK
ncbi:decarboxylating NADP(+)-dependent phosphogluconate dehydrogenase [candidate division KSB1 bacterium]